MVMGAWDFVPNDAKKAMGMSNNKKTKEKTKKLNSGVPDWMNTYMKNSPGMQPYVSGASYGATAGSKTTESNKSNQPKAKKEKKSEKNKPTTQKQTPTQKFIEQQKNKSTTMTNNLKPESSDAKKYSFPNVKKASAPDTKSSSAVSNNSKSTSSKTTTKPKPKATKTKVTISLPDGVKTTGYINPKDNRTYYDKDFTKPLKTKDAKVTVVKGSAKPKEFTRYKKFEELS